MRFFYLPLGGMLLCLLAIPGRARAQTQPVPPATTTTQPLVAEPIVVTGRIADSATRQVLPFASAALFTLSDSIVSSTTSGEDGRFALPAVPAGRYVLRVSYVGYAPFTRRLRLNGPYDAGMVRLGQGAQQLEEVEIIGRTPPSRQRGDTTEFNAAAFKVNRDATSEDLVGKMPGITNDGGTLKAQGETITQVTVDGKPFFGDDPTQTLRNLPAEMVDKVQLLDQRSETSRLTGFDDGNRQKTLNIVTKANRRQGAFGKASASVGTEGKYAASAVGNVFDGNRRVTLLAQSNNINQQNFQFQDLGSALGGGNRGGGGGQGGGGRGQGGGTAQTGSAGGGGGGPGGFGNFLVGQQNGINTTTAAGTNYSDVLAKNLDVNGSYFFNRTQNANDQTTNRSYISGNPDSAQKFREIGRDRSLNFNHRANIRMEWKPDTNNTVVFRPRFNTQQNTTNSSTLDTTSRGRELQSVLDNTYLTKLNALNANLDLVFRHRFKKIGRSLVLSVTGSALDQDNATDRLTQTQTYQGGVATPDSTRQRTTLYSGNAILQTGVTYTEGLGKRAQLLVSYEPQFQWRRSNRETDTLDAEGLSSRDARLSNRLISYYMAQQGGLGAAYNYGKLRASGQLSYQRADLTFNQSLTAGEDQQHRVFAAFLPQASINYKFTPQQNLMLNLNSSTSAPYASQLQRVVNVANALQLSTGNPNLRQSIQGTANLHYSRTSTTSGRLFSVFGFGNLTEDYIGNTTFLARRDTAIEGGVVLPAGGQLTRPDNLGRQITTRAFAMYATPLKAIKSNLSVNLNYSFTSTPGRVNFVNNLSLNNGYGGGVTLSSNISERVDFTLSSNSTYSQVANTVQRASNYTYFTQTNSLRLNLLLFWKINFTSTVAHTYYNGLAAGYNQNYVLWNATLGKKLGKDNQWEAQIIAFDLLKQNNAIQRTISDVYVQDTQTNVLRRYFMIGVTYTLRKFKGAATPDQQGPNGPGGPGGPPFGPGRFGPPPGGGPGGGGPPPPGMF